MALVSLPSDILTQIIFYTPSIADLAALSQSCRLLHSLCDMKTRERFHCIAIRPDDDSINHAFDFLMKILKCPQLGSHVRQIEQYQKPERNTPWVETEEHRSLKAGDRDLLHEAVHEAGFVGSEEAEVLNMLMQNSTEIAHEFETYSRYCCPCSGWIARDRILAL